MSTPDQPTLVFLDTETTSLRPDRRAWDIALIVRSPTLDDVACQWFVAAEDLDLGNANPYSLEVGHFYRRHPQFNGQHAAFEREVIGEAQALRDVERLTRGAHLVGCVPSFDADVLDRRMRAHGILPSWHYHLVDVENLAAGLLQLAPPWDSEALSDVLGVPVPGPEDRHTALGDARWARDMYDAVMTRQEAAA